MEGDREVLSGTDIEESEGDVADDNATVERVSLGSLVGPPAPSPRCIRHEESPARMADDVVTGCLPIASLPADETLHEVRETGWFHANFLPRDPCEVLAWHPNRVRAALVT